MASKIAALESENDELRRSVNVYLRYDYKLLIYLDEFQCPIRKFPVN